MNGGSYISTEPNRRGEKGSEILLKSIDSSTVYRASNKNQKRNSYGERNSSPQ